MSFFGVRIMGGTLREAHQVTKLCLQYYLDFLCLGQHLEVLTPMSTRRSFYVVVDIFYCTSIQR